MIKKSFERWLIRQSKSSVTSFGEIMPIWQKLKTSFRSASGVFWNQKFDKIFAAKKGVDIYLIENKIYQLDPEINIILNVYIL